MENGQVELDGIIIPYCEEGGDKWYPIRYITEKFLLKGASNLQSKDKYKNYIKIQVIDYTFKGTSPQETNCMNKNGWTKYLSECKLNKNKDENKLIRHNLFCDYIGCNNKYNIVDKIYYDDYMKYCIEEYMSEHSDEDIKWYTCVKCERKFPLDNNFFPPDDRVDDGYTHRCKNCKPSTYPIICSDSYIRNIYKAFENEGFTVYKQDIIKFYNTYCHNKSFEFKGNEANKILIIKWYYDNKLIDNEQLHRDFIKEYFNFKFYNIDNNKLNEIISNNDCEIRPWLYINYNIGNLSFDEGKEILSRYIIENNIQINSILEFNDYEQLLKDSKLGQFTRQTHGWNSLKFIVRYYEYKYAGYKYKLKSTNYYKDKESIDFDMKWFIEKDLKIPIERIPLYVTKYSLHTNAPQLYTALRNKYYYNSLFEWIEGCYPNKFIELDFDINPYRSVFDSMEEAQVDEQMRNRVGNIIHNERNKPNTININGMIPDWLMCLDKGFYLIEFFGMYNPTSTSSRHIYYINKMKEKIQKYKDLEKVGYNTLFIYPNDIKHNFEGLHKKLDLIIA